MTWIIFDFKAQSLSKRLTIKIRHEIKIMIMMIYLCSSGDGDIVKKIILTNTRKEK